MNKYKGFYTITIILTLIVMSIGATYAFFAATVITDDNSVASTSKGYSLNLSVIPQYPSLEDVVYPIIPMLDKFAEQAYTQYQCKDKNNSGACYAYRIRVYDYTEDLDFVSGLVTITTSNVTNLKYMVFEETTDENENITLNKVLLGKDEEENEIYHMPIVSNKETSIGDSYSVKGKDDLNLILVIWLSDIEERQNEFDIGRFNGNITFTAGKGGKITGRISSAISGSYSG